MCFARAEPVVTLEIILKAVVMLPGRPAFNFIEPSGTAQNKTFLPLQPLNSLLTSGALFTLECNHGTVFFSVLPSGDCLSFSDLACLWHIAKPLAAMEATLPGCAYLPRPCRHPAIPIQGASTRLEPLLWPSCLLTGGPTLPTHWPPNAQPPWP